MTFYDFLFIILAGGFGGLMSSLHLNEGVFVAPSVIEIEYTTHKRKIYHFGSCSDIVLGMGAGLIASLPLGLEFPKYIYASVLAGFGGGAFIANQAKITAEDKARSQTELPDLTTVDNSGTSNDDEVTFEIQSTNEGDGK